MNQDRDRPNEATKKSRAEGERWGSEEDTVERLDREAQPQMPADEGGGITNRPLQEEARNQDLVPGRGEARKGGHAGHGDAGRRKQEER